MLVGLAQNDWSSVMCWHKPGILVDDADWTDGQKGCLKEGPAEGPGHPVEVDVEDMPCDALPAHTFGR